MNDTDAEATASESPPVPGINAAEVSQPKYAVDCIVRHVKVNGKNIPLFVGTATVLRATRRKPPTTYQNTSLSGAGKGFDARRDKGDDSRHGKRTF